jgi:hypothetical protein
MKNDQKVWRRFAAAALVAAGLTAGCTQAYPGESAYVKGRLVQVDVYDRAEGAALPVYNTDGRNYIVGAPGHEYGVRVRNCTGARVLVVTSVDGVNVISGDTAAPGQSGYVLDAWGSVEIAGWRKSFDRTAAFFFTDLGNSYAARTGRPDNVGVIGVAVFQEKPQQFSWREQRARVAAAAPAERDRAAESSDAPAAPSSSTVPAPSASQPPAASAPLAATQPSAAPPVRQEGASNEAVQKDQLSRDAKALGKLGTGYGRSEESHATFVAFERASSSPAETVALQYDRRENLVAMGVLPPPRYARRQQPDPFPAAVRFAPDPGRY